MKELHSQVEQFIRSVGEFRHCHVMFAMKARSMDTGSKWWRWSDEMLAAMGKEAVDISHRARCVIVDEILPQAKALAPLLAPEDAKLLLKFCHIADRGGGWDKACELWPDLKATLQVAALPATAADYRSDPPKKKGKPKEERRTTTTIERDLAWLEEYERDFESLDVSYFAKRKKVQSPAMRAALRRARNHLAKQAAKPPTKRKTSKRT